MAENKPPPPRPTPGAQLLIPAARLLRGLVDIGDKVVVGLAPRGRRTSARASSDDGEQGLVLAYHLNGQGGGHRLDWDGLGQASIADGPIWLHLDCTHQVVRTWLHQASGLSPADIQALTSPDTRPRLLPRPQGLLLALRSLNHAADEEREDLVALRAWFRSDLIITLRRRRVLAVREIAGALDAGNGPTSPAAFLVRIAHTLVDELDQHADHLDDEVDRATASLLAARLPQTRALLTPLRREVICLLRHLAPQKDVLLRLQRLERDWLGEEDRHGLREIAEQGIALVEDLESIWQRAALAQEELAQIAAEETNHRLYLLTIITALLMPLTLLTGLLGCNVGGIPGADDPRAFLVLVLILVALVVLEVIILHRLGWLRRRP